MKNPNIKLVAIVCDISGGCQYVGEVKNVTREEYATLLKEQRDKEQEEKRKISLLEEKIEELEQCCESLTKEIKVLKGEDEDEESIED